MVYDYLPLFMLPLYAALERMDWRLIDAAKDLGASEWGRVPPDHAAADRARPR